LPHLRRTGIPSAGTPENNMNMTKLRTQMADVSAPLQHLVERFEAELAFTEQLGELHPTDVAGWQPLIKQARAQMTEALVGGCLDAIPATVAAAEALLAPVAKVAKSYTVHCVGHAHIDMNWMWSWPETVAVTVDTFSTMLRLMEEYPDFKFSQSQASTYAIIERHRPDLLKRIAQRVKEGRWEVTASHWVEGDKNMAGGESLSRHLLYTRSYLRQLFGLRPEDVPIDWSPDTFGHAATVPTYLVRGGVKYLYLHRPGVHTASKLGAFWWEGPDGARVLVRNDKELGYLGKITPDLVPHLIKFVKLTGGRDFMFVYGVGDHGGGPTRRDLLRARDMNTWPVFPSIQFSTARVFYERLEQQAGGLPVVRGELNTTFTGCYTTATLIKKANRFAENRLVDAELASVLAWGVTGQRYPAAAFVEAWRDTLFSHFHDILPGSGVHDTRTYTHGLFQKTMATTSQAELAAWRRLASLVDTSQAGTDQLPALPPSQIASGLGAGVGIRSADGELTLSEQSAGHGPRPFVLFNPTTRDRAEIVEAMLWDNAPAGRRPLESLVFAVRQPDGTLIAPQRIQSGSYWGHGFVTLAFPAKVAGLGYAQYAIVEEPAAAPGLNARQIGQVHHCSYAAVERSVEGIENDLVRVELDPTTGGIRSLVDKRSGLALINAPPGAATLEYAVERPHGMTAWSIDHTGPVELPTVTALRRPLAGPYKASIEVDLRIHESTVTLTYELRAGDPKLYLHIKAVWFQRGTRETGVPTLRLAFPLALTGAQGRYEIPFGAVDRPLNHGEEVPALQWAAVTGQCGAETAGCLLLNDSKHGHALDGSTLRLTLIRSSYDPDILPEIGQHEVHTALQPFAGELPVAAAIGIGQEFNHALRVIGTDVHTGRLPVTGQFVTVAPASVVLSTVKKSEAGNAMVVRVFNPTDKKITARIKLNQELLGAVLAVQEVDLLERSLSASTATAVRNTVNLAVPARGIASVLVKIKR
jgi:alpha-mannosidase